MEELVIKKKLATDEKLIRRVAKRSLALTKSTESTSDEFIQNEFALRTELELMELAMKRESHVLKVCDLEHQFYIDKNANLTNDIEILRDDITNLKRILEEEQRKRLDKDEFDKIAKEILKYPNQEVLSQNLKEIQDSIESVAQEQSFIQKSIEQHALEVFESIQNMRKIRNSVDNDLKKSN